VKTIHKLFKNRRGNTPEHHQFYKARIIQISNPKTPQEKGKKYEVVYLIQKSSFSKPNSTTHKKHVTS
jgi:hypothetical protein